MNFHKYERSIKEHKKWPQFHNATMSLIINHTEIKAMQGMDS